MRIQEIEDFYDNHIHDTKVLHFEKMRIKLKKLFTYEPEILNQIESASIQHTIIKQYFG